MTKSSRNVNGISKLEYLNFLVEVLSLGLSIFAILLSLHTYYNSTLREGKMEVKFPDRIGWVKLEEKELMHGKKSDVLVLSFVVHNDGNVLRNIRSVDLTLKEASTQREYIFKAHGQFSELKDITYFTEKALEGRIDKGRDGYIIPDYKYSLMTGISLDRNEYKNLSLLFLSEDDDFELGSESEYRATLKATPFDEKKEDLTEQCFGFVYTPNAVGSNVLVSSSYILKC